STGRRKVIGIGREVKAQHRDGSVFPVELSVGEAMTSEGRRFIGIIHDLRQRYANEERVNQLQANMVHMARVSTMDEMGAALAHELNQPLTALMLYLQAVERACERPDSPARSRRTCSRFCTRRCAKPSAPATSSSACVNLSKSATRSDAWWKLI